MTSPSPKKQDGGCVTSSDPIPTFGTLFTWNAFVTSHPFVFVTLTEYNPCVKPVIVVPV